MTKSELITKLAAKHVQLPFAEIDKATKMILDSMTEALAKGRRIEMRGFGSFCLHYRAPRKGRNPKTGDVVALTGKHVPHFKVGKELRDRVNNAEK